jgi:ribosomal-protein-alanine N-acetyltransferase
MNTHSPHPLLNDSIEILPAVWRDLSAVRELEKLCFSLDAWPLLDLIGVLAFPNIVRYKAVENGEMIGFVAGDVKRFANTGWIATICVHPNHRGRGLGAALLQVCEEKMGMPRVKLSVRESNTVAIDMYSHNGYVQVGTWTRYYKGGENGVVMEKLLGE